MADTPETPKPSTPPRSTTRRHAPRKTSAPKPQAAKSAKAKRPASADTAKPAAKTRTRGTAAKKERDTKVVPATTAATSARSRLSAAAGKISGASEKLGGKWGSAAIAGGLAVVGAAATAALLSLRGSTPRAEPKKKGAHSPDGRDASASFDAGIADENSVPDQG
ncbi:hypothetical protein [uncultured Sphingomonas sp.]|mgnify:CR=1 FL=1|uniref:hypothetical protein n=1 Tax=uncultured Sphingomonas sp. TaxID=158754 RepID=UPI0026372F03|nr:hypothetical protein [uncultured Sphingomonas sp.]